MQPLVVEQMANRGVAGDDVVDRLLRRLDEHAQPQRRVAQLLALVEYCVVPDLVETFYAITVKRHFEPPLLKALLGRDQAEVLGMAG